VKISIAEDEFNVASQFLAVGAEYDKEHGFTDDTNDFLTCNAYGVSGYTSGSPYLNFLYRGG
jgi:alcohol oxidase